MNGEGMRQAAVLLASLHPRDRAWIRHQLPDSWGSRLKELTRQVSAMGRGDSRVLREALLDQQTGRPEPPTPDVLMAGLDGLPASWIARTLTACAPDHRELCLSGRSPSDQTAIERALREGPSALPPKLAATLAQLVRQRGERALATESRP